MKTLTRSIIVLLAVGCAAATAQGETVPTRTESVLLAPRVATAPKIDGKLDDDAWKKAQPIKLFSYVNRGIRSRTDAWICRYEDNIYIAARCYDDNLDQLVTENKGRLMWRNDCLEIFVVPNKDLSLWTKLLVTSDGRTSGSTWVRDEWKEPTEGAPLKMTAKTGREKNAWTVELVIPLKPFGLKITSRSKWAFGLNREKWSGISEVSSFMGGFNKPTQYPDLVFDNRTIVFDGVGVRNIGEKSRRVKLRLASGEKFEEMTVRIKPGQTRAVDWRKLLGKKEAGHEFSLEIRNTKGSVLARESYKLVKGVQPIAKMDPNALPAGKFPKGPLDDPNFFPVGVWLQPAGARTVKAYKNIGVNIYFGGIDSYPRPKDKDWLDNIHAAGMYAIIPIKQKYIDNELYKHPAVIGWHQPDEPDLAQASRNNSPIPAGELLSNFIMARAIKPNLPVFLGLSQGVANDRYIARVISYDEYPEYCKTADILGYDIYPCNSLGADGPNRLAVIAKGMDRLAKWTGGKKRLYFVIEANKFTKAGTKGSRSPTPEEVKTQMWMAIVHGARGLSIFCHSWAGKRMKAVGIAPEMMKALKPMLSEIHNLAAVINSPTVVDGASAKVSGDGRISTMVKKHGGATYVFAVNMFRKAEKPVITVKGAGDGVAEVLFEDRKVPLKDGKIVDEFAPYAVHRYKIVAK